MDRNLVLRIETLILDSKPQNIPTPWALQLERFTQQHYCIRSNYQFTHQVLGIGKAGDLVLFYDKNDHLVGFTRYTREIVHLNGRDIAVFMGGTYHDQRYNLIYPAAKFGLTQAMKYKLTNPEQEQVFFSLASTPSKYQFLMKISDGVYPRKGVKTPEHVLKLVQYLKKHHQWVSSAQNPLIIGEQLTSLEHPNRHGMEPDELSDYYLHINPDYQNGQALLVYLPLNLASISQGIKKVVSHSL